MSSLDPVHEARGLVRITLLGLDCAGMYAPNGKIYILREYMTCEPLIVHERVHAMQRRRDGYVRFWARTIWYLIWYGYTRSPYEVEAMEYEVAAWNMLRERIGYRS